MRPNVLKISLLLLLLPAVSFGDSGRSSCEGAYKNLGDPSAFLRQAEKALDKTLSNEQVLALSDANNLIPDAAYTPNLIAKQEKILRKAGLTPEDIRVLRLHNAIANTKLESKGVVPESAEVVEMDLKPISLETLSNKKKFRYIVDNENNVFVVPEESSLPPETLWLIQNKNSNDGTLHLVKETGILDSNGAKKLTFHPDYNLDATRDDIDARIKKLESQPGGLKVNRESLATESQNRVLKCVDILAKNTSVKRALLDRVIADNLVVASAMVASEVAGAHRLSTENGRQVVTADFIGNNTNSLIGAYLGKYLIQSNRSLPTSLAIRTGMAMGMIEVQKNIYKQVLKTDSDQRASKIANFDRAYFFARLPIAHFSDQFILKKLPEMLFDACKKDSKITVYVTPQSVRIAERYASTFLYYGARSAIVSE